MGLISLRERVDLKLVAQDIANGVEQFAENTCSITILTGAGPNHEIATIRANDRIASNLIVGDLHIDLKLAVHSANEFLRQDRRDAARIECQLDIGLIPPSGRSSESNDKFALTFAAIVNCCNAKMIKRKSFLAWNADPVAHLGRHKEVYMGGPHGFDLLVDIGREGRRFLRCHIDMHDD